MTTQVGCTEVVDERHQLRTYQVRGDEDEFGALPRRDGQGQFALLHIIDDVYLTTNPRAWRAGQPN